MNNNKFPCEFGLCDAPDAKCGARGHGGPCLATGCSTKKETRWYVCGDDIMKMGPFKTQAEAVKHVTLSDLEQSRQNRIFPAGVFVWPEEVP